MSKRYRQDGRSRFLGRAEMPEPLKNVDFSVEKAFFAARKMVYLRHEKDRSDKGTTDADEPRRTGQCIPGKS